MLAFDTYASDRDPNFVDVILSSMQPNLDKLILAGNSASDSAMFDDLYLSGGGYNASIPRPFGASSNIPLPPAQINLVGGQVRIQWSAGVLESAPSVTGPWSNVPGASSPWLVTPSADSQFYRTHP